MFWNGSFDMRARASVALAAFGVWAVLVISIGARDARACSICGCDPSGGVLGLERPAAGDLRLSIDGRYLWKESGTGVAAEGEKEGRTLVGVQYSPIRRFSAFFEAPFYVFKSHYDSTGFRDEHANGIGDVLLGARWEFLQFGGLVPKHTFAVTGALKMPTGDNRHLEPVDLGIPDEHKQLGRGTWDKLAGLWYTYGDFPWVAYAGGQVRLNGTNSRGFRYGHAVFGTLGARRTLLESRKLYVSLEAQARNAGYDLLSDGTLDPDSGGLVGYATVGAGYQVTMNLLVRATVQIPAVTALHGQQREHLVGFLGFAYDISL
jgi:hypothetical protein